MKELMLLLAGLALTISCAIAPSKYPIRPITDAEKKEIAETIGSIVPVESIDGVMGTFSDDERTPLPEEWGSTRQYMVPHYLAELRNLKEEELLGGIQDVVDAKMMSTREWLKILAQLLFHENEEIKYWATFVYMQCWSVSTEFPTLNNAEAEEPLEMLRSALTSSDGKTRNAATRFLSVLLVYDENDENRETFIRFFKTLNPDTLSPDLGGVVKARTWLNGWDSSLLLLSKITSRKKEHFKLLVGLLEDKKTLMIATRSLGYMGPSAKEAIPGLKKNMASKHWQVRLETVRALIRISRDPEAIRKELLAAFNDEKWLVGNWAKNTLIEVGLKRADEILPVKDVITRTGRVWHENDIQKIIDAFDYDSNLEMKFEDMRYDNGPFLPSGV